jgi:secreted trypsin-like serine protease
MQKNILVAVLVMSSAVMACGKIVSPVVSGTGPQIVHGSSVKSDDPHQASVVGIVFKNEEGEALCTGSLIAEDTVLTAAHCVDQNPSKIAIVFSSKIKGVPPE